MNCSWCKNKGFLFAKSRLHIASDYVFKCGCLTNNQFKNFPRWEKAHEIKFAPQYLEDYKQIIPMDLFFIHNCIKENNIDDKDFKEFVNKFGKEIIWAQYKMFKEKLKYYKKI